MAVTVVSQSGPCPAEKFATVIGSKSSDEAKIGGITPALLSLSGRWDASPWNMRFPTWRLGYCTSRRRCARSMNTMKAITPTAMIASTARSVLDRAPWRPSSSVPASADGSSATMPAKMMSEIPLPTPRAVICSPSHIKNTVPPTSVITVVTRKNQPGSNTTLPAPSNPTAMP